MSNILERTESAWFLNMQEPRVKPNLGVENVKYAYVKYVDACHKKGPSSHAPKEVVPISRIKSFNLDNVSTRIFSVRCGEGICRAIISHFGETKKEVMQMLVTKRPVFAPATKLNDATDLSSANEDKSTNRKKSPVKGAIGASRGLALKKLHIADAKGNNKPADKIHSSSEGMAKKTKNIDHEFDSGLASSSDGGKKESRASNPADKNRQKQRNTVQSSAKASTNLTSSDKATASRETKARDNRPGSVARGEKTLQLVDVSEESGISDDNDNGRSSSQSSNPAGKYRKKLTKPIPVSVKTGKNRTGLGKAATETKAGDKRSGSAGGASKTVRGDGSEVSEVSDDNDNGRSSSQSSNPAGKYRKKLTKPIPVSVKTGKNRTGLGKATTETKACDKRSGSAGGASKTVRGDGSNGSEVSDDNDNGRSPSQSSNLAGEYRKKPTETESQSPHYGSTMTLSTAESVSPLTGPLPDDQSGDEDANTVRLEDGGAVRRAGPIREEDDNEIFFNKLLQIVSEDVGQDISFKPDGDDDEMIRVNKKVFHHMQIENRALRVLNLNLQRKLILNCEKVEATIQNVDLDTRQRVKDRIAHGEDLSVGFLDEASNKIHAGYGIWIKFSEYERLRVKPKMNPSKFMANVARLIFTDEVMLASSVTGTVSNAIKNKRTPDGQRIAAKPKLDARGLDALSAITRHWMKKHRNMSEGDIVTQLTKMPSVIAHKISDMIRPPRKSKKPPKRPTKTNRSKVDAGAGSPRHESNGENEPDKEQLKQKEDDENDVEDEDDENDVEDEDDENDVEDEDDEDDVEDEDDERLVEEDEQSSVEADALKETVSNTEPNETGSSLEQNATGARSNESVEKMDVSESESGQEAGESTLGIADEPEDQVTEKPEFNLADGDDNEILRNEVDHESVEQQVMELPATENLEDTKKKKLDISHPEVDDKTLRRATKKPKLMAGNTDRHVQET